MNNLSSDWIALAFASVFFLLIVVTQWILFKKAGYSGLWALIMFFPVINILMIVCFPLLDWPITEKFKKLEKKLVKANARADKFQQLLFEEQAKSQAQ